MISTWSGGLISEVLRSYGIITNRETTDRDLLDIEVTYWNNGGAFFVLVDDERIIGTLALRRVTDFTCELCRTYLAEDYRGRGLGRKLLEQAFSEARALGYSEMVMKTASVLEKAISLYGKAGFARDTSVTTCGNCNLAMRKRLK